jgi:hypothetical protein
VEPQPTPTRRTVLRGSLALAATGLGGVAVPGCTGPGDDEPAAPPAPDPDVVRADEAAVRERRLLAAYDLAMERAPDLTERLAPLRAEHAEHLAALGVPDVPAPVEPVPDEAAPDPGAPEDAAPADDVPAPAPRVPAPPLPLDPAALLPALADLERKTAAVHAGAAVRSGRGLAVVLAAAAASEASHPLALG